MVETMNMMIILESYNFGFALVILFRSKGKKRHGEEGKKKYMLWEENEIYKKVIFEKI